ncbi:MAG TPA: maleylpyruvate isomerase family mycothiol-dependent enzyme [Micromonosporaceae bacterium]|nr:maleylpyruvate isomerase family mycothiol-dependent enzyme [Micromonosporaceae bacterium]
MAPAFRRDWYADLSPGARLLLVERDALLPILRALPADDFDRATSLPGWAIRDVLAHCAAAMTMAASGTMHGFTPQENQRDVDGRRDWPIPTLLTELAGGYEGTAAAIAHANGRLDGLALGEWTHGGDVREALGRSDAYASEGLDDALTLAERLSSRSRSVIPRTDVRLPDRVLRLGRIDDASGATGSGATGSDATGTATLETDSATFIRMLAGRSPDPSRYRLHGADPARYLMFG